MIFRSLYKKCASFLIPKKLNNIFNSANKKRVLISYSTRHFIFKKYAFHPSYFESNVIASIFDKLGYRVDIVDNNYEDDIDLSQYNIIFGEGFPMYKALANSYLFKVYYSTGAHPFHCNDTSRKRLIDYYKKSGYFLPNSCRLIDQKWGIAASCSDVIICIGNEFTKSTFEDISFNSKFYKINPSYTQSKSYTSFDNINYIRNDFLFFGSYGLLHKGLDLYVEAAKYFPEKIFHVCGKTDEEFNFLKSLNLPLNVKIHGFIDINSQAFNSIVCTTAFVVLPSCSEGISTAVINAVIGGAFLPIVTRESGIDIGDDVILVDALDVKSLVKAIKFAIELPIEDYRSRAKKIMIDFKQKFSPEAYKNNMEKIINEIIMVS